MNSSERKMRDSLCRVGRLMVQNGLVDGAGGNISARLDQDRVLLSPSGLSLGFLEPEQLLIVNLDGDRIDERTDGNAQLRPTSESPMHLECYLQRDDVRGVVHAHPPTAIALTLVGYDFQQCVIPEAVVLLGLVPTAPYSTPSSQENRDAISGLICEHDAIMLSNHGSLTVAKSLWDAYLMLECLEHCARILHMALQVGDSLKAIPPDQIAKLVDFRQKLGLMRPGDQQRFSKFIRP